MLCLKCIYKSETIEISDSEFEAYKQEIIRKKAEALDKRIPENIRLQIVSESIPYKTVEDFKAFLIRQMEALKRRYSVVIYCKAKKTIVVGEPEKRAQSVTSCDSFVESSD